MLVKDVVIATKQNDSEVQTVKEQREAEKMNESSS